MPMQEDEAVEEMVQQKAVGTALGLLQAQGKAGQVEGLLVNLLANLTTSEAGCKDMLAMNGESSRSWYGISPPPPFPSYTHILWVRHSNWIQVHH